MPELEAGHEIECTEDWTSDTREFAATVVEIDR
jgi:hypothetical protein